MDINKLHQIEQSEHKDNHNKNQVKQIADKKFKVITIGLYYPSKKAKARGLLQDNMANGYNGESGFTRIK